MVGNATGVVAHTTLFHIVVLPVCMLEVPEEGTPSESVLFLKTCQ